MSKIVSRRSQVGVMCLIISIAVIISIFAYFVLYSNMNIGFIGNKTISNTHDLTNHLTGDNNPVSNFDDSTSILVTVWIGLMIVGGYLLYHIHFKVLPKE